MTSAPVRDPLSDHLLTPENAAFVIIDYQPSQLAGVRSMDQALRRGQPDAHPGPSHRTPQNLGRREHLTVSWQRTEVRIRDGG